MPEGSSLHGSESGGSRLRLASRSLLTNYMLMLGSNASVRHVVLDGALGLPTTKTTSVLVVNGSGSLVRDVTAANVPNGIGVHFIADGPSSENLLLRVEIRDCYYGVVFAHGLHAGSLNTFEAGLIEDILCDAVVFVGHGALAASTVRRSGHACATAGGIAARSPLGEASPQGKAAPPGAAAYCSGNIAGGAVIGNAMYDACGMILDVDSCADFDVSFNELRDPGNTMDGLYSHCRGASTATLLDSRGFRIEGNVVENGRGESNAKGNSLHRPFDPNRIFSDIGAADFSDLPRGRHSVLNFVVAQRPRPGSAPSRGHAVVANVFQASCPEGASCKAVGLHVGRGTGEAATTSPPADAADQRSTLNGPLFLQSAVPFDHVNASDAPNCSDDGMLAWRHVCGSQPLPHAGGAQLPPELAVGEFFDLSSTASALPSGRCWLRFECVATGAANGAWKQGWDGLRTALGHGRSLFTGNAVLDSDHGSRRCGRNDWASSAATCKSNAPPPCNADDIFHGLDAFRNDPDCADFKSLVGATRPPPSMGGPRGPLPLWPNAFVGAPA